MATRGCPLTANFKQQAAVVALCERNMVQAIASRHEVHSNQVSARKRQAVDSIDDLFPGAGPKCADDRKATIRELAFPTRNTASIRIRCVIWR